MKADAQPISGLLCVQPRTLASFCEAHGMEPPPSGESFVLQLTQSRKFLTGNQRCVSQKVLDPVKQTILHTTVCWEPLSKAFVGRDVIAAYSN